MPTPKPPSRPTLPERFNDDIFIGRRSEIKDIVQKAANLQQGAFIQQRTIRISGERGVGKTWLLLKLHRDHLKKLGALSIFVDFDIYTREKQTLKEMEFRVESLDAAGFLKLLKALSQALGVSVPTETSIQEQSYWVMEKLTEHARQQVVVLLLDGLFTAPPKFVDLLEDYLLAPIISLDSTLVILTGRGKAPLFSNYYLRNETEDERLEAFAKETIKTGKNSEGEEKKSEEGLDELFTKLKGDSSYQSLGERGLRDLNEIYRASGGFPRTALILARDGLEEGVENAINELLSFIEEKDKRETVRQHLEALVLLNRWDPELPKDIEWGMQNSNALEFLNAYRFFHAQLGKEDAGVRMDQELDEGELQTLSKEKFKEWEGKKKESYLRMVRGELQALQLLRWETKSDDLRGYFIDEAVRYPIAYAIRKNKPGLWRWLHYVGWKLFDGWAKTDTDKKKLFELLAEAHREAFSFPDSSLAADASATIT